ncbi:MAG: ion transporter [Bacteroidia bacterium]|nr:ion transporter [Bacteroidia bacterium]NNM15566.1 ion transporter [Bacteroidia bacterium]
MSGSKKNTRLSPWQTKLHTIIYEADTPAGRKFDIWLLYAILISVFVVILESVPAISDKYADELHIIEWFFTIVFTIEYVLRIVSVGRPLKYIFSFYGIIDLLSIIPTYLTLIMSGGQFLAAIRILRLMRVFRIFKLVRYVKASRMLLLALRQSRIKIFVFLGAVFAIVVIMGTIMYMVEGHKNGFESIPKSIYWSIVTLTTVGYGDIVPHTVFGRVIASFLMLTGYAIIAVPTGIMTVEIGKAQMQLASTQACQQCSKEGHDADAVHCKFCGAELNPHERHVDEIEDDGFEL